MMLMMIRCDESVTSRRVWKTAGGKQMIVHILVYNLALGYMYNGLKMKLLMLHITNSTVSPRGLQIDGLQMI